MTQIETDKMRGHSLLAKVFHWGFALVFVYGLTKQVGNVNDLADAALLRFEVVFALGFLALLVVRFVFMQLTRPTVLPENTPRMMRHMARAGHLAIYASLAMIALSGLAIGALYNSGGPEGWAMAGALAVHETAVLATYLSIGGHIAAALFHRLKGDGIWSAMVPFWKEPNA